MSSTLRQKQWLLIITLFCVMIVGSLLVIRSRTVPTDMKPLSGQELYKARLGDLTNHVDQLKATLDDKNGHAMKDKVMSYNQRLIDIYQSCQEMIDSYDSLQQSKYSNAIKDSASEVKQLCDDVFIVLEHARLVASATDEYLLIDTSGWPASSGSAFGSYLSSLRKVVYDSAQSLESVSVPRVNDPGIKEQSTLLRQTEKIVKDIDAAVSSGNNTEADKLKNSLLQTVEKYKNNLWDARSYYWRNTVQLKGLENKLHELGARF